MANKIQPDRPPYIIIHYAEIGVKGKNRSFFERKLQDNVKRTLRSVGPGLLEQSRRIQSRLLVTLTAAGQERLEEIIVRLQKVFGVAYFAPAWRVEPELKTIEPLVLQLLRQRDFTTFRITTRKSERGFPHSAHLTNELVGATVVEQMQKPVKLKGADVDCRIDLFYQSAFVYCDRYEGPGGLPVGSSGRVTLMLSGGIDSPVAAYYAAKRGVNLVAVHFHSLPYTTETAIEKIRQLIRVLNDYQPRIKLYLVALTPIQQEILVNTDEKLRVVLYRRFMFRITEEIARREGAQAIITGESIGQVASQTIENMAVIDDCIKLPVLRPLIGFDKNEIIDQAVRIESYDISIQPHVDCCTLFVPKHPATRARLEDVLANERRLSVAELVETAVSTAEYEIIDQ